VPEALLVAKDGLCDDARQRVVEPEAEFFAADFEARGEARDGVADADCGVAEAGGGVVEAVG